MGYLWMYEERRPPEQKRVASNIGTNQQQAGTESKTTHLAKKSDARRARALAGDSDGAVRREISPTVQWWTLYTRLLLS